MKKSYFGITSLIAAVLSDLFLGANYVSSQLSISPETFSVLNNMTALVACSLAPLAALLGLIGFLRKNDSKLLSGITFLVAGTPFLILFVQMVFSITRSN